MTKEQEAANRISEANRKVIESLGAEHDALAMIDKQRYVSQALRRLSAEATDAERGQVRQLAGTLFDEQKAIEARNKAETDAAKLREKGRALTQNLRTAEEAYKAEIADLNRLLAEGAISQETFTRALEDAYNRQLQASREWSAGVQRALQDYADEAGNAASQFEQVTTRSLKAGEDAFVQWASTGKFRAADLFKPRRRFGKTAMAVSAWISWSRRSRDGYRATSGAVKAWPQPWSAVTALIRRRGVIDQKEGGVGYPWRRAECAGPV